MKFLLRFVAVFAFAISALHATDLSITVNSFLPSASAEKLVGTAGATITKGQLLYYDSTASTWKLADANSTTTTAGVVSASSVIAIAASDAVSGQSVIYVIYDADMTLGATLSMSAPFYCVSATAGGIAPVADVAAGWYPNAVIVAKSTTKCVFNGKALRGSGLVVAP